MTLLVDTSVWSLALRRDRQEETPEVRKLRTALTQGDLVASPGVVLQELLQGFVPARVRATILDHFAYIPLLLADRDDHVTAAQMSNTCRSVGIQLPTVDALIATLAVRHGMTLLTTDRDFHHAAPHIGLDVWTQA
ncbi:MAG: type II toxin-antitoxin system VapC family toxin [Galactobacter sp.]|uniref:type II toxin-antitoxin system VapC family toxin n=1 Tax=Galactobacter sp. TaxID=2676125 RepID=UPI0025BBCC44|nr:PIN domain-containing protein [Galactobacter sp.]